MCCAYTIAATLSPAGPISVTIHVNNDTTHILDLLDSLETLYTSSPQMSRFVDVHLVVDFYDRQFNTWRNIARLFARTDFVMMLDIDFYLCTDFRTAIRNSKPIMEKLREGRAALVIPAFEYTTPEEGADYSTFPKTKEVGYTVGIFGFTISFPTHRHSKPLSRQNKLTCSTHLGRRDIIALTMKDFTPLPLEKYTR